MIMMAASKRNDGRRQRLAPATAVLLLLVLGAMALPAAAAETPLKKVSFMPLWSPQAQFAGYYVALDKGIYAKHGIDLTILRGGPGHSPTQALQSGAADFAVLWLTTAIQQCSVGNKLVNVAQIIQRSSLMLIAKKSSGIVTPADMQGKKAGLWGGDLALPVQAFFKKYHLQVKEIPQSYTVNLFLRGGIDVTSAMWYNEYHTILNSGINPDELNLFFLNDYGIKFPEDGLYTSEKSYRRDPALAKAFAQASLEGWRYAFDHSDEALDTVIRAMKAAKLPANRAHQKWMLERMHDLILPQQDHAEMGHLKLSDYETVGAALQSNGVIKTLPAFAEFTGRADARQ
jgi:NitT/TauT family transport system substrate-binding protein